jgi:hypothetical protein|tara:strand:+ start:83 stop:994 length:912 start_codon:yes stop_codon:yes gene_type:complete
MKIYENKDEGKRTFQCSYCWNNGHNKRACSQLKAHYLANKDWGQGNMPIVGVTKEMFSDHYQKYHGDAHAQYQFRRHFVYAEKLYGEQAGNTPKKRKKTKCGFCKSEEHTRRKCKAMGKFIKILEETEKVYRTKFYDQIIVGLGFGLGAFIEFSYQSWDIDEPLIEQHRGLVTKFDPASITIGNLQPRWNDYHTSPQWQLNGKPSMVHHWVAVGFIGNKYAREKGNIDPIFVNSNSGRTITNIMAPSPSTPDKEWFLGKSPAFDWVVKKRTLRALLGTYQFAIQKLHPDGDSIVKGFQKKLDK